MDFTRHQFNSVVIQTSRTPIYDGFRLFTQPLRWLLFQLSTQPQQEVGPMFGFMVLTTVFCSY